MRYINSRFTYLLTYLLYLLPPGDLKSDFLFYCLYDLDVDPMTLTLEYDLDSIKMYLCTTKIEA